MHDNTITGLKVNKSDNALYLAGIYLESNASANIYNNTVQAFDNQNTNSAPVWGIKVAAGACNIYNNIISNLKNNSTATNQGRVIGIESGGTTATIYNNTISNLNYINSQNNDGWGNVAGILAYDGTTATIYNNVLFDLKAANSVAHAVSGITFSCTTVNLYNNTVYLDYTSTNASNSSACVWQKNTGTLDMRNNIFINKSVMTTGSKAVALWKDSGTISSTTNNNLYYAGTPGSKNLIFYNGTAFQTLLNYQAQVSPKDNKAVTEATTPFVSTSGTYNLHIDATQTTVASNAGTVIGSVTTDMDGDTRDVSTPDIGADEFWAPQTITFTLETKTYGDEDFTLPLNASSGLPITYASDDPSIATVSGNTVHIVGAGICNITANQAGNASYYAAPEVTRELTVNKADPTITLDNITKIYGDANFTLDATSNSTGAITYTSSEEGVATISGNTVTIIGAGTTTITVTQVADDNYNAATGTATLTVSKASQTITFEHLTDKTYGDIPFTVSATGGSSGNPVTFTSSDNSIATCTGTNGSTITIIGAGDCPIYANQAGTDNYSAAEPVGQLLTVVQSGQTITFEAITDKTYGNAPFNLTATASSGLPVSYISSNTSVATVLDNQVTIVGVGTTDITASQAGNVNYEAATVVTQSLTVAKADQVLTLNPLPVGELPLKDFTTIQVTASSSSELPVVISLGLGSAAILNASNQLENIGQTGNVVINVKQVGNENYNPANISHTFDVVKSNQSITFGALTNQTFSPGLTIDLSASASSSLPVSFTVVSGPATLNGSIVTVTGAGEIVIQASQEGNASWNPATDVTQTLVINKATPVITNFADITKEIDDAAFILNATSASTGLFTYSSDNSDVATVLGNTVTIVVVGTAELTATQNFDENYTSATATITLTVLPVLPTITTASVSSVTTISAVSGGNVTDVGGDDPTVKGIVWATVSAPTVESNDGITSDGTGAGSFVSSLAGLSPNTTYYVRAYATNGAGTAYGLQESFTTSVGELTWDGSESNNWHSAANWDLNIVPSSGYNVLIPAGLTNYPVLSAAGECNNLTIESNAVSTASLLGQENLTAHGIVTVEQYLTANAWHLVSSPAPGQTLSSFLSANTSIPVKNVSGINRKGMMDYDETSNNWNSYFLESGQAGALESGKGFSLRTTSDGVVYYTGTLATGNVNTSVSNSGTYGWNCVGNPYTSAVYVNSNAHATNNFIDGNTDNLHPSYAVVYVWEQGSGTYSIIGQSDAAYYAQAGQAFMVKAKIGASGVDFTTAMQTQQPDVQIKSGTLSWPEIELIVSKEGKNRGTKLKFSDAMTTGLDVSYDAGVFKTGYDIYTKLMEDNGIDFGLQCLPETGMEAFEIPVGIDASASGEISFSLKSANLPSEVVPILNDKQTGASFSFKNESDVYTTSVSGATKGYGRFTLTFAVTTGIKNTAIPNFKAWYNNGYIYISGQVEGQGEAAVYDIQGRKVAIHQLQYSNLNQIIAPAGANSIYLVKIRDAKRNEVLKVPVVGR